MFNLKKKNTAPIINETDCFGDKLSFEAMESFNLLRTNINLSFSDEKKCHIIGITSPIPGAGKSLVSSNLSYSIAKSNKKVLLIDCDLRLPTINKKIGLNLKPGLTNALVEKVNYKDILQTPNDNLDVLTAGDIPPNPSELLGSTKFSSLIKELENEYDYIVLDLTPVNIVADALNLVQIIDGFVLVVRKDHDNKVALNEALRQLNLAKAKIVGIVFNSGKETN
ncbi:MAG: CpsD/CapB family tyrosine-protein kinase, partial [Firmicutes bacterium]|nr:CpsD/CapB family tyrosine-protein kinase [Candidatus Caballimonas caccae]